MSRMLGTLDRADIRSVGRSAPPAESQSRDPVRPPLGRSALLTLQRSAGNRAVTRLVLQRVGVLGGGLGGVMAALLSPPLKRGNKGPGVLMLQQELNKAGAALKEDSDFGPSTQAAVRALQTDHALPATGSVDAATWAAIRSGARSPKSAAPGLNTPGTWLALSAQQRADWTTLGYTAATWRSRTPPLTVLLPYALLTAPQRAAATRLGFTRTSWKANRDRTAGAAAAAFAGEEKAAKKKAGAGVLPAKFVGSLRAKAMLEAEFGGDVDIQLPKVHLLTAAQMKTAWEGIYGAGTYSPVNGFAVKPDIYLNQSSVWSGTTVHESLHIQEHASWDAFAYKPTSAFGEGATTLLTERTMTRHERAIEQHSYPTEHALMAKMVSHAGLDKLKAAYFKGGIADFRTAVTAGLKPGTTWAQFRALVDSGALAAAQARLK